MPDFYEVSLSYTISNLILKVIKEQTVRVLPLEEVTLTYTINNFILAPPTGTDPAIFRVTIWCFAIKLRGCISYVHYGHFFI